MNINKIKSKRGFTLIELLIVISIISLLSSIVYAFLSGARESARIAAGMQFEANVLHGIGDQLVGEWKFDEGAGTAIDTSGFNNNGTVISSPVWSSTAGYNGKGAYTFNGSNYISLGNFGSFYLKGTISFWMNSAILENWKNPFTTKSLGGNSGIRFEENSSGTFGAVVGIDGATGDPSTFTGPNYLNSGLSINTWYHVVLTWDTVSNILVGYLNGVQKFNQTNTLWPTTLPSLTIGGGYDSGRYWKGKIDNVRIYSASLTAMDVQKLYAEEFPSHQQDLAIK